jgi:hypothetical protein
MGLGPEGCAFRPETMLGPRPSMMVAALASVLGMAANGRAETWTVVPSLYVGARYDDNLFFNNARLGAAGLRAGPALSVEYQPTVRLKLLGRAGLDSEYSTESEASRWPARQNAALTARYRLGAFTSVSLSGEYARTAYAAELIPSVGVEYGRRTGESLGSKLELEHRVSSKIVLRAGGGVLALRLEGSGRGLRSQLSSDAGLVFLVTPHTRLAVQVGPRYLAGSLSGYVSGALERTRPRTRLFVGYERGRSLVFDRTLVIESYAARLSYRLSPGLTVSTSPALFRQWEHSEEQRSWRIEGAALYRARSWLTVFVNHTYVLQRGLFIEPLTDPGGPPRLSRNILAAGFSLMPDHVAKESK